MEMGIPFNSTVSVPKLDEHGTESGWFARLALGHNWRLSPLSVQGLFL